MMLRTVLLAFAVLALAVFVAVAAGVRFVGNYVREHRYTIGELETLAYDFGAAESDGEPVRSLAVEVQMAAGTLALRALDQNAPADQVAHVQVTDNIVETNASVIYTVADGRGNLALQQEGDPRIPDVRQLENALNAWELRLAPRLPLHVEVNVGAGELTLDMADLLVEQLTVELGAGEGVIDLRRAAPRAMKVQVDNGVGAVTVYVPADFGVRLEANAGLGNVEATGLRFVEDDGVYVNAAYRGGAPAMELEINTGVGEVVVTAGAGDSMDAPEPDHRDVDVGDEKE